MLTLLLACRDPEVTESPPPPPDDSADTQDTAPPPCGTAGAELPDGLTELSWDNGTGTYDVVDLAWTYNNTKAWKKPQYEGARFELDRPARIHAVAVQWTQIPEDPLAELPLGIYPDFGYNGFDFWKEPLWTGTRCAGELTDAEWATYTLAEPIEIDTPGLVYVAQYKADEESPLLLFDADYVGDGSCASWDDCHSIWNYPEIESKSYYTGLSFPFPYDYMVRLYVEYLEEGPGETVFSPTGQLPSSRHAFGDFDNDGDDDLFTGSALWENDGGTFTDVTAAAGLSGLAASGGVWGDYDNDACLDLLIFAESTTAGETLLHNNCDGTFSDVTAGSGISDVQDYNLCAADPASVHESSPAAAWWDMDADGLLDLYVAGFICWTDWTFYDDRVYHNEGGGVFTDVTDQGGLDDERLSTRGVAPADGDGDGDVDLFVNTYTLHKDLYFQNLGDGSFEEDGKGSGLAGVGTTYSGADYYGHGIGAAWGDLDNDEDLDLVVANLAHPRFYHFSNKTGVWMNQGNGKWQDVAVHAADAPEPENGLRYQETASVPAIGDFDSDGALDLAITNVYVGRPTDFYWGQGDGSFELDAYHSGLDLENGWGITASDWDHDGDLDLATSGGMYENTWPQGHFLQVRVVGNDGSNWAALGATVRVSAGGETFTRVVSGGDGQGGQSSMYLHFGLGSEDSIDRIEVVFPGGRTVAAEGPFEADQRVWVFEDGSTATGWAWPS